MHPALLAHPCPKTVYIGGGGEGSTAREVLRHKSVEKCVMVDIDGDVVRFCKEALPENAEAFADPRLELVIDDAKAVLETGGSYDVIIMDLDDTLEGGPCYQLYTTEFYQMIKAKLNPGGVFVTQSGQAGMKRHHLVWAPVHSTLRTVFPAVRAYNQAIYSFMDEWGWNIAFTDPGMGALLSEEQVCRTCSRVVVGLSTPSVGLPPLPARPSALKLTRRPLPSAAVAHHCGTAPQAEKCAVRASCAPCCAAHGFSSGTHITHCSQCPSPPCSFSLCASLSL